MTKRALVTGITGQDGSYLAEHLLTEGYQVIGMVRRASTMNFDRIIPIQDQVELVPGDLHDEASLINVLRDHRPDEVYNLAAQSFVQTSFNQPVLTGEATALGVTRMLDAIRIVDPEIRFYQASSSEMFGKVVEVPQSETTPFYPRSPYGVAKVYGHWITVNYRESYDLHATSGILFNHECVPAGTPVVVRRHGYIDILPIEAVVPHRTSPKSGRRSTTDGGSYEVWDGRDWSPCLARTATWHDEEIVTVHGRGGVVTATADHVVYMADGSERPAGQVHEGDEVLLGEQPPATLATTLTDDEAWLLGVLTVAGRVPGDGTAEIRVEDHAVLAAAASAWERITAGTWTKDDGSLRLAASAAHLQQLHAELHTPAGSARVPSRILNAAPPLQVAYLMGCNRGGLDGDAPGADPFATFTTASPALAAGLAWLSRTALGRRVEVGTYGPDDAMWMVDLRPNAAPDGHVDRVDRRPYSGWMFDLATESGRFAAGVGFVVVHNSPRRGVEFVTRKITYGVARIKHGVDKEMRLGNLDAKRDWGFAGDYVKAMWLMVQQDHPADYVVATGETHSVREFCQLAFAHVGLDYEQFVVQDERFVRPAEVDYLVGDAAKAKRELGWEPEVSFADLVSMMVEADMQLVEKQLLRG